MTKVPLKNLAPQVYNTFSIETMKQQGITSYDDVEEVIAGYSYNHTKVPEGNKNDFYSEPGRAPGGQGQQVITNEVYYIGYWSVKPTKNQQLCGKCCV